MISTSQSFKRLILYAIVLCSFSFNSIAQITIEVTTNDVICYGDSHGSMTITVSGGSGSYNYSIDAGSNWQAENSFNNLSAGDYNISIKDVQENQTYLNHKTVTISQPEALVPNAGEDQTVCSGSTTLNANTLKEGETGAWSIIFGSCKIDDLNSPKASITDLRHGENILRWTVSRGGCSAIDDISIYNDDISANAGVDIIAKYSSAVLSANEPAIGMGSWSVIKGEGVFDHVNKHNATVSGLSEGINTFRWTVNNGSCQSYDDVNVEYRVSTSIDEDINRTLKVYPTPASRDLNIQLGESTISSIEMFDLSSRKVKAFDGINSPSFSFDISSLDEGVYILHITSADKKLHTQKVYIK